MNEWITIVHYNTFCNENFKKSTIGKMRKRVITSVSEQVGDVFTEKTCELDLEGRQHITAINLPAPDIQWTAQIIH